MTLAGSVPCYWVTISVKEAEPTLLEYFHLGEVEPTGSSIATWAHTA